jgi:hypothetical protein
LYRKGKKLTKKDTKGTNTTPLQKQSGATAHKVCSGTWDTKEILRMDCFAISLPKYGIHRSQKPIAMLRAQYALDTASKLRPCYRSWNSLPKYGRDMATTHIGRSGAWSHKPLLGRDTGTAHTKSSGVRKLNPGIQKHSINLSVKL